MAYEKDINKRPEPRNEQRGQQPSRATGSAPRMSGSRFNFYWIYLIIIAILFGVYVFSGGEASREVDYSVFSRMAQEGDFKSLVVNTKSGVCVARLEKAPEAEDLKGIKNAFEQAKTENREFSIETTIPSADKFAEDVERWSQAEDTQFKANVRYEKSGSGWDIVLNILSPFIMLLLFWFILFRGMGAGKGGAGGGGIGGIFNVGRSKAQVYEKDNKMSVTFQDVAGLSEAKQEVQEIVEFLKNPQKFTNLGGKIPKGALLVGPPGTGKTLLAKAVAGEADVPFFSMSGSDFVEMFVGVGASRVRDLFRQAKEKAPCIIFIDEIDAVGRARSSRGGAPSNDERESTLNQLLTEMDGFGTNSGVIILAATNRADILDKALLRAGRFDRQIHVDLPELQDRIEIFHVHLRPLKLAADLDIKKLARQTPGFSGADIANVCNEAALIAARNNKKYVDAEDFNAAVDRIIGGLEKKSKVMTQDEKHSIAVHEAGHATISWFLRYGNPLVKVTIVPRGNALGAAWYMPEERQIVTYEAMCDQICGLLGGRAAEELFIGAISSGAANDLERVTKQAYAMVAYYGMSRSLPNVCYYDSTGQEYSFSKPFSEDRAKVIDEEISKIIAEQYERSKQLLIEHREGHNLLAQTLEEREVIFTEDVEEIFGPRPWTSRSDELLKESEVTSAPADAPSSEAPSDNNQQPQ